MNAAYTASRSDFSLATPPHEFTRFWQQWLSAALGAAVALFGLLVLIGAWFAPEILVQRFPATAQVGLGTAGAFMLTGMAVSLGDNNKIRRSVWLIVGVALILLAGINFLSFFSGVPNAEYWRSLLDTLLAGTRLAAWPGWMSMPTAFAFGLCGLMLMHCAETGVAVAQVVIGGIILLGLGGVLMQLTGLASLYLLVPNIAVMSWLTGIGFILLGVGLLTHGAKFPWFRAYYDGREDRRVFAYGITILLVLVLIGWSVGVGRFVSQSIATTQRTLLESLRITSVLVEDALEKSAANTRQILLLSRIEELLAGGGGASGGASGA